MKTRRDFLKVLGAGAAAVWLPPQASGFDAAAAPLGAGEDPRAALRPAGAAAPADKPNFVFILVDDLGWADLGCYGNTFHETPHADRLAAEGVRFTNAYAACAVCSPTRASILTGRYPARLGITDWIRARFQGGAAPGDGKPPSGYTGRKNQKVLCPANALWLERGEITLAEALKTAGYTSGHIGKWHLGPDDWYPEKQGFDVNIGGCDFGQPPSYFDPYESEAQGGIPTLKPQRKDEYLTDREADEAVRFIREHRDQPFFLYLSHYAVHTPIQAKADAEAKYRAKETGKNAAYAAMIASVDDSIGRVLDVLGELDLAKKTAVILCSDNGGLEGVTSNAPLRGGKGTPYEGGIRVPAVVRWPGRIEPGKLCDAPIASIDFFPTLCAAAGLKRRPGPPVDGRSLMPLLEGADALDRDALFWHFPHYRVGGIAPYSIIRSGNWKLIKRYDGKPYELFDLKNDLSETTDLAEQRPDKVGELDARLAEWLEFVDAKLPRPNPDYDPDWKPQEK